MPHQTDYASQTKSADEPGRGSARLTSAGAAAGWPIADPSLLEDGRPVVPAFPLDTVPQPWREWVSDTAAGAGAPVDYVAQAVLGAVAGLCGAGVKACVTPSWSEPLVLWQALVGAPSAGKTPALDAIGRPLASVETLLQRDSAAGASPMQAVAGPVQGGKACPEQGRRVVVYDPALAALTRSVAARPPGVLLWRDEPTPWLHALARETSHGKPRGPFVDAWSAASGLPVSVLCSLHPDGLVEALEGTPDGWAARFLFAWPSPPAPRGLSAEAPPREDEAVTMLHRIGVVGRHARAAARARLRRGGGEERRAFPRLAAGGDKRHRGRRGRLAGQGPGHGRASGRPLRAARLVAPFADGAAARHRPARSRAGGDPPVAGLLPAAWPRRARSLRAVRFRAPGAPRRPLAEEGRRQDGDHPGGGEAPCPRQGCDCRSGCLSAQAAVGGGLVRPAAYDPPPQGGRPPQRWEINPGGAIVWPVS